MCTVYKLRLISSLVRDDNILDIDLEQLGLKKLEKETVEDLGSPLTVNELGFVLKNENK